MKYVPSSILNEFDLGKIDKNEFVDLLAKAVYIQKLERKVLANAISLAFNGDEE